MHVRLFPRTFPETDSLVLTNTRHIHDCVLVNIDRLYAKLRKDRIVTPTDPNLAICLYVDHLPRPATTSQRFIRTAAQDLEVVFRKARETTASDLHAFSNDHKIGVLNIEGMRRNWRVFCTFWAKNS